MNKDIYLSNSLGGKKEKFTPINPKKVRMYVCGPTVYDDPHIGNARPLVVFDILFKVSEDDPTKSKLRVTIDVSSINTDNEMRDENLMDEDYFSLINFPKISFQSNKIIKTDSSYLTRGIIDMMGLQNELSFDFIFKGLGENNRQQKVAIFEGEFTLNRVKLGMPTIKSIGDQVDVKFYCELIEKI